jgi:rare lipoprotein A (peptidoglycan hydrolase)
MANRPSRAMVRRRRRAALAAAATAMAAFVAGLVIGAGSGDEPDFHAALASTFATYGEPLACGGTLQVGQAGTANKTLPCGTQVLFRLNGRETTVPVIDRGPYVAGRDFDLTAATASALRFDGLGTVEWAVAGK